MTTKYFYLKDHFDRVLLNMNNRSSEYIRDTYETAYKTQINLFDVYQDDIKVANNPIDSICTLVGPDDRVDNVPDGIMVDRFGVVYTHVIGTSTVQLLNSKNITSYVREIHNACREVISRDQFYGNDKEARNNMLVAATRCLPFYITFCHIKGIITDHRGSFAESDDFYDKLNKEYVSILTKYIVDTIDSANEIIDYLLDNSRKMDADICNIYNLMTCSNTVELFK